MAFALNASATDPDTYPWPTVEANFRAPGPEFRPAGLARLLRRSFHGEDLREYAKALIEQARHSDDTYLLLELSLALQLSFQREAGVAVLQQAVHRRQGYQLQRSGQPAALRLLVIKTIGDLMANTPLECILEDQPVDIDVVYVTADQPLPKYLPPHDLIFVAIAEADAHCMVLQRLEQDLAGQFCPVLNYPQQIPGLARPRASQLLAAISGLYMPSVLACERYQLEDMASNQAYPLPWIIRPQGTHAGQGLARVADTTELDAYLATQPGDSFFVAPFVDYASADGLYRKYRIVMMDGQAYPCHMGVSAHWMVHYPYAEMKADASRREEESQFMQNFQQEFGQRHLTAMQALQQRLGLEYVGFDCAETRSGDLLIFEVANALVIHAMDLTDLFPYKASNMRKVFAGFTAMLQHHACQPTC